MFAIIADATRSERKEFSRHVHSWCRKPASIENTYGIGYSPLLKLLISEDEARARNVCASSRPRTKLKKSNHHHALGR